MTNIGNDTTLDKSLTVTGSASLNGGLNVTGDVSVTGGITSTAPMNAPLFHQTSDYRVKHDVKRLRNCLNTILKLKPSSYTIDGLGILAGLLAHEVQEHVPNAVNGEKDGLELQRLDYIQLIPYLIGALQEQQNIIEELVKDLNERSKY